MVSFIITIVSYLSMYFIFEKMNRKGWEGLIPFYNIYVLFEVLYGDGVKFLTLLIPFYNIYVLIKLYLDLARAFNQSAAFGVGLLLVSPVFNCILAFSNSIQFKDGKSNVDAVGKIKGIFK